MARKHRKLFPTETTTNQTQDCSGLCDPACPYNCYTNYPDYYFSPPPPSISSGDHSGQLNHISSYLIILVSLFTVIFVVVGFYVIKVKCYADWCGRRGNGSVPSQSNNSEDEFLNENQVDHPVWLIATVGLQQSIINSITACRYRKDEGLIEGTECSVCLNEFQEGETLRLLPKCSHAFHIPCIDTWLRSHTNCPLCRAGIVSNNADSEAAMSNFDPIEQDNTNLGRNQESQIENSPNDDGLSSNNTATTVALENSTGTEEASEAIEFNDESNSKEQVNFDTCHVPPQLLNDQGEDHGVQNDEIQTEIRPVSPGLGKANSCSREPEIRPIDRIQDDTELRMVSIGNQDGDESKRSKTMRRSSIEECLHISPVSMKRSLSCSARILSGRGYMSVNSTHPH